MLSAVTLLGYTGRKEWVNFGNNKFSFSFYEMFQIHYKSHYIPYYRCNNNFYHSPNGIVFTIITSKPFFSVYKT